MFQDFVGVERPELLNPLVLAYIGDAVYEVYVRAFIIGDGAVKTNTLHKCASTKYVSAKSQAKILDLIIEKLNDTELNIVRRGRNSSPNTIPKNADIADYKKATAFEALIGYLFLSNQTERLDEIMKNILD